MTLRLYNTLTRTKEDFVPLDPANVRMYVCGPTVYDYAHIGNARPVIVFDVLFRLLRHIYGPEHVTYVRNITDVDDKINARAAEEGVPIRELTERTAAQFHEDIAALGVLPPTHEPRATDHITAMVAMIEQLLAAGLAYEAQGHVLFDVSKKADYGKLAHRSLDEMIAGARVEVAPYKKGPMDFVLWKPSDEGTPGWDSPFGRGRPGWHLECSAMSGLLLGETFDIHGGGIDLLFPHHENEIAQSEGAHHGHALARYWLHNGHLQVEGEKMSKSLGNFVTIHDLLHESWGSSLPWDGDSIRFAMLTTHYRQPIDWTMERLQGAWYNLETFMALGRRHLGFDCQTDIRSVEILRGGKVSDATLFHLRDDLNTPAVQAHLFSLAEIAKQDSDEAREAAKQILVDCLFLGIDPFRSNRSLQGSLDPREVVKVKALVSERVSARKEKNFAEADRIRDELAAKGIVLMDNKDGTTTWEVKR